MGQGGASPAVQGVNWRDSIELQISDPDLRARTERFLDYLQGASFEYLRQDPSSGKIVKETLTGQQILGDIAARRDGYVQSGMADALRDAGLMGANRKFVIAQHDRLFDGSVQNGANTAFANVNGRNYPLRIEIGTDYLRGARYYDAQGGLHPVTVEGVLANELGHLATGQPGDQMTIDIENIIAVQLGAEQRVGETVEFTRNANGGFQSLLPDPKALAPAPSIDAAPVTGPPKL